MSWHVNARKNWTSFSSIYFVQGLFFRVHYGPGPMKAGIFVPNQTCQLLSGWTCLTAAFREEMEEGRMDAPCVS